MAEILYRRCNETEAKAIKEHGGLVKGRYGHKIGNLRASNDPDKWLARSASYLMDYDPKGVEKACYQYCVKFELAPGTVDALVKDRQSGRVKKGKTGTFGIPPNLVQWFNQKIVGIQAYDLAEFNFPSEPEWGKQHEKPISKIDVLGPKHSSAYVVSFFVAFPKELVDGKDYPRFNHQVNLNRMTWLKTSLLWAVWKSNWGKADGQGAILRIDMPQEYLARLAEKAVSTKAKSAGTAQILFQRDPDRRIVGRLWTAGEQDCFVKAGHTVHFGIRGNELINFIRQANFEKRITDITRKIRYVLLDRPEHPKMTIYDALSLEPIEFEKPKRH